MGTYSNPPIDQTVFGTTPTELFWTSTPVFGDASSAWAVNFAYNGDAKRTSTTTTAWVRCVR